MTETKNNHTWTYQKHCNDVNLIGPGFLVISPMQGENNIDHADCKPFVRTCHSSLTLSLQIKT